MGSMTSLASDSFAEIVQRLDARIKRVDEERWLSSRYADGPARSSLIILYAFYYELARVRLAVSDQTMGQIRFQWWRDAIEEIERGQVREHELVEALAEEFREERLTASPLLDLIDLHEAAFLAHDRDLEPEGELARQAMRITAPSSDIAEVLQIAPGWAKLRRGETLEDRPSRCRVPADARPALAHLRLRHPWARGRQPGPMGLRLCVLLGVLTGMI